MFETLGRGGMGVVYRAFDRERGVQVALKTLHGVTPDGVLRFKTEFRALRDLRHPNLVELGELFESDGLWLFTMELVRGLPFLKWVNGAIEDLESAQSSTALTSPDVAMLTVVLKSPPSTAPRELARELEIERLAAPCCDEHRLRTALAGLARGLSALHRAGKVHRDVKPSNIIVEESGRAVLLDFGVVSELSQTSKFERTSLIGTVKYMAPEQARGDTVGPAADWYAVGVILFRALAGRFPLTAASDADLVTLKQQVESPSPRAYADGIPDDLAALCESLLRRAPEARPSESEILAVLAQPDDDEQAGSSPPGRRAGGRLRSSPTTGRGIHAGIAGQLFVGRRDEIEALVAALDTSRRNAVCVLIEGESGVGKSALMAHFLELARAHHRRTVVLRGRCHERERVPYNAFDGVVDDLSRYLMGRRVDSVERLIPETLAELLEVFPALRAVSAFVAAAGKMRVTDIRGRGFTGLLDLLARLGARRRVVIAIDDIQWADADSAALLDELLSYDGLPLCIVATKRPREGQGISERLAASRTDVRTIALGGLDDRDAADLVRRLGGSAPTIADAPHIVAESHGHPLFLRELVRHRDAVGGEPVRLEEAIWSRARRLDSETRRLLITIAVAGAPIPRHAAVAATGLSSSEAEASFAALTREHLVRVYGSRPQDHVETFHDRVREAVYVSQPPDVLRELHLALSRSLEAAGASPDALLAHVHAAGDHARAAHYRVAAADAALRAFAFARAAELYRRALERPDLATAQRVPLLVRLGEALANDGRVAEAGECSLEAARLEPADSDLQLDLLRQAAERFLMSGQLERGLETTRSVLERVNMAYPTTAAGTFAGLLWNQLRTRGGRLVWSHRTAGDPPSLDVDICWSIGAGLSMMDTLRGAYFASRGAVLALEHGNLTQIARAMAMATVGAAVLGRRERAGLLFGAARRAADEDGAPATHWYASLARMVTEFALDNDFRRSLDSARLLEDSWYALGRGPGWETDIVMHFSLASQQLLGQIAEMAHGVAARVQEAKRTGNLFQEVTLRVRFALRHLMLDRPEVAEADVVDALAAWQPRAENFTNQRAWALWSRNRISLYAGKLDSLERDFASEWRQMRSSFVGRVPLLRVEWYLNYGNYLIGRALAATKRGHASESAALYREADAIVGRLLALNFPSARATAPTLRASLAWARKDGDLIGPTRIALEGAQSSGGLAFTPALRRRLGEAVGGDEGKQLVEQADVEARCQGYVNAERAAEIVIPTGRFS
ncbi:MAG: AAA family ATPase [Deltaproteobacteria bacterium]